MDSTLQDNSYNLPPLLLKRYQQFKKIQDKTKIFERIIALGKKLEAFDAKYATEDNLVKGCVSVTYIYGEIKEGKVFYSGDSNSHLVKGLVALLVEGFSGLAPEQILKVNPKFIEDMGLANTLTASRANGFMNTYSMLQQIAKDLS